LPAITTSVIRAALLALPLASVMASALAQQSQPAQQTPAKAAPVIQKAGDKSSDLSKSIDNDIIVIEETISGEEAKPPVTKGPPPKEKMLVEEAKQRLDLLKMTRDQVKIAEERAAKAANPAEAQVWLKEARLKADTAESLKQGILGKPPSTQPTQAAGDAASHGPHFGGALQQLLEAREQSLADAADTDLGMLRKRATTEFGSGRAGAGGVALYKSATMITLLDPGKMKRAIVEGERLILVYGDQRLAFPAFNPQFLALAIRSIYGGEGQVPGTVIANEANAIVLRTGKERYGDVAWKKEFLPDLPPTIKVGDRLTLELGPGVGALSVPDPSYDRITYYGPLQGTLLGQVVQESDMVFSMFWYGVHWKTGLPLQPKSLPGYESAIEIDLKARADTATSAKPNPLPAKNWWEDTTWFVWTPGEMSLQVSPASGAIEFTKATMKADVWSVRADLLSSRELAQGKYLTDHYDEFSRAFPVLEQLREAAKTVAAVRWLKKTGVSLDLTWAKNYPLMAVDTPERVLDFTVYVNRDDSGRPQIEPETSP
jgi:hypothetical protein